MSYADSWVTCGKCHTSFHRGLVHRCAADDALAVLCAIGEAIATVARARIICTLMDQQRVRWTNDDESVGYELWFCRGNTLDDSILVLSRYTSEHPGRGERIDAWDGYPVDVAAEAVARLIAEVQS